MLHQALLMWERPSQKNTAALGKATTLGGILKGSLFQPHVVRVAPMVPDQDGSCEDVTFLANNDSVFLEVDEGEAQASRTKERLSKKKKTKGRLSRKPEVLVTIGSVSPSLIGSSLDEGSQVGSGGTEVPAQPQRPTTWSTPFSTVCSQDGAGEHVHMPAELPFHFRLDVSGVRFDGHGEYEPFPDTWYDDVIRSLEKEWTFCRQQQEQAWIDGELPLGIRQSWAPSDRGFMGTCLRDREQSDWVSDAARRIEITPMQVVALERTPGVPLQKEDLEIGCDGLWCRMVYDVQEDPLLKQIGYQGRSQFVGLLLAYEAPLNPEDFSKERYRREVRFAHIDHFEFAICCPASPYTGCQLQHPPRGIACLFELDYCPGSERLCDQMFDARAALTWLFWECFDELVPQGEEQSGFSRTAWQAGRRLIHCKTRSQALVCPGNRWAIRTLCFGQRRRLG